MNNEMVEVVYKGFVHTITKEEFEDLKAGRINWSDMFD